jgi:hypothetical protein
MVKVLCHASIVRGARPKLERSAAARGEEAISKVCSRPYPVKVLRLESNNSTLLIALEFQTS